MSERRDVLRESMKTMHRFLDRAPKSMTAEQLNFRPREGGQSAFFSLWHYVRTEDNVVNYIVRGRPTVWLDGGYDVKFGLPRTSQGTGMTEEEANALTIADPAAWLEYQRAVWAATDEYLAAMDPAEFFTRKVRVKPIPEMTLWDALYGLGLGHGYRHGGEIEYVRGVQGLGGLTI